MRNLKTLADCNGMGFPVQFGSDGDFCKADNICMGSSLLGILNDGRFTKVHQCINYLLVKNCVHL